MLSREQQDTTKNVVAEFFRRMGFSVEIREARLEDNVFSVNLESDEPQIIIGEQGQTLAEIQHLLRLALRKKIDEVFYLDLDVNSYKKKKTAYLEDLAKTLADEVALTRKEKELPPMPAQERRIIHLTLSQRPEIETCSRGEEPNRCVVIKPKTA